MLRRKSRMDDHSVVFGPPRKRFGEHFPSVSTNQNECTDMVTSRTSFHSWVWVGGKRKNYDFIMIVV